MHSIAHFILQKNPSSRILYVTSEEFTNEVIEAIRNSNNTAMTKFREKYRNIDVLLIDDVQFIIGKNQHRKSFSIRPSIRCTAPTNRSSFLRSSPKDMDILEDRIRSVSNGDSLPTSRARIMKSMNRHPPQKQELDGYSVSDDVIEYIASNIKSNIRELEGALNKIIAYANLEKREINIDLAEQVLRDIISPNEKKVITPEFIIDTVADHFDITPSDIVDSKRSSKSYSRARSQCICAAKCSMPR